MTSFRNEPRRDSWRLNVDALRRKSAPEHVCEVPGCEEEADYKAPHSPDQLNHYHWFCLPHVREYNEMWDYFADKDADDIEAFRSSEAIYGERKTWQFGLTRKPVDMDGIKDYFGFFAEAHQQNQPRSHGASHLPREERDALKSLEMDYPTTVKAIKTRYKELVKKYHPDVNKDDKHSEDRFKAISTAYRLLMAINKETGRYEES